MNLSAAELEAAIGAPFAPPAEPLAARAIYCAFVIHKLAPDGRLPDYFLLGDAPNALLELEQSTMDLRREHTLLELKEMLP